MDLSVLHRRMQEKKRLEQQLQNTDKQIATMEDMLQNLKSEADAEWEDVDRMESGGFTSKLYSFLGRHEEKLDKERSEAEAAQQKFMDALYTIQNLQKTREDVSAQLATLGNPEQEYQSAFRRNQEALSRDSGPDGQAYRKLQQETVTLRNLEKEIHEAEVAGDRVLSAVRDIERSLNSASGWGVADMVSDSFLADLAKYGSMDEAKRKMQDLKYLVNAYARELKDLNIHLNINMDVGGGMRFADYFFDNIFTDAMTYDRINRMKREIHDIKRQVQQYNEVVSRKEASLQQEIETRREKAEAMIIRYKG